MVTPISEWEPQVEEVTLPSGRTALLKRPDLVQMISGDGEVPDLLSNLILDMTQGQSGARDVVIDRESLPQILQSMNVIAKACFVEPKLTEGSEADGGAIPLAWVSFGDKAHVMAWALGGRYEAAKTFPAKQNGRVGTVPAGKSVRRKA